MKAREKTLLLIEDNRQDELLTLRALEKNRILSRVMVVRDGQEAIDYLFRRDRYSDPLASPEPQVVLLDLKLPKLDGLEVLKQVRANQSTQHIPIVILTTSSEISDISRAQELGANSFVRKPVNFEEFNRMVKELGEYWLGPIGPGEVAP